MKNWGSLWVMDDENFTCDCCSFFYQWKYFTIILTFTHTQCWIVSILNVWWWWWDIFFILRRMSCDSECERQLKSILISEFRRGKKISTMHDGRENKRDMLSIIIYAHIRMMSTENQNSKKKLSIYSFAILMRQSSPNGFHVKSSSCNYKISSSIRK